MNYQNVNRILEVVTDLKIDLNTFQRPVRMAIDVAILAHRREFLKLEKWLSDRLRDRDGVCEHILLIIIV